MLLSDILFLYLTFHSCTVGTSDNLSPTKNNVGTSLTQVEIMIQLADAILNSDTSYVIHDNDDVDHALELIHFRYLDPSFTICCVMSYVMLLIDVYVKSKDVVDLNNCVRVFYALASLMSDMGLDYRMLRLALMDSDYALIPSGIDSDADVVIVAMLLTIDDTEHINNIRDKMGSEYAEFILESAKKLL